jgi:thioredoxin-like negative regulator of GroEL
MKFNRRPLLVFLFVTSLCSSVCLLVAGARQSANPEYQASLKAASRLMMAGNYDDAVQEFRNAIKLSGGTEYAPYWGLAQTYNQLNDKLNTLETCDRMIALAPTDVIKAQCHNLKGLALAKGGTSDQAAQAMAEAEFRAAIKLDPDYSELHFNLGKTLLFEKKVPEGTQELNAYLKENPDGADSDEANQLVTDPSTVGQKVESEKDSEGDYSAADEEAVRRSFMDKQGSDKGRPVPNFSLKALKGEKITPASLRGKVVLVDFWASWCGVCKESFPDLNQIYNDMDKQQFILLSVDVDLNEHAWKKSLDANKPEWLQARDGTGWVMHQLAPETKEALPTYVLIDRDGNIQLQFEGWGPGARERLEGVIDYWIKGPSTAGSAPAKSH